MGVATRARLNPAMKPALASLLATLLIATTASAATRETRDFNKAVKLEADAERGEEIFAHCVACHGADGGGQDTGSVPRIAGQHYRVLLRQLVDFRHGKRWDPRMEGVATSHTVVLELQDLADVAMFASRLSRDGSRGVGDGENVELGEQVYAARCDSCHGPQGEGDDARGVPRISGQHAAYLSRQIYDAVDGRRPQLSRTHGKRLAPLDFQQVKGLADWLSRVGWQAPPGPPAGSAEPDPEPISAR